MISCVSLLVVCLASWELDLPADSDQVPYAPEAGAVTSVTPPAFVWVPVAGAERYVLQYAQDAEFPEAGTVTVRDIAISVHIPTAPLAPGKWHWRYGVAGEEEVAYSKTRAFTIPADATEFPLPELDTLMARVPESRPRIYFTPERVEELRREVDGRYAELAEPVIRAAERHIGEELYPEPPFLPEERQARTTMAVQIFRTMRPFTAGMETCAMAYIYTGDERFAAEAKRRLLHFSTWDLDGSSNVFNNTEPAMDIAQRGPRTFDWIYDTLTEEEREICISFLSSRIGDLHRLHRQRPFESRPYSSHPGRMVPFVVEGSLVFLHEAEDAPQWLDYTLKLLWSVYPAWGSDDGGWHEGLSYWSSYGNRMLWLVSELDRLGIPWKDKPFLRNTGYFGLYAAYPNRRTRAFGDGYEHPVGGGHGNLLYAYSSIYENPHFRWYAEQAGGGPSGPIAPNVYRPEIEAQAPVDLPPARLFENIGWATMHSDLPNPENNIFLLFKSNPYGAISHDHANQNAFVIEAFGEALAISSGYYQRYGSPHHSEWVWQTKAHNALLIDGEGQDTRSAASKGRVTAFESNGTHTFTTGDATPAYGGRAERVLRHILFRHETEGAYIVMVDEVAAARPVSAQWLLHAKSEMELDEAAQRLSVAEGDARMRVHLLHPEDLSFRQTSGWDPLPDNEDSPAQFHFQASTTTDAERQQIVAVLLPHRAGGEAPEPVFTRDGEGFRLEIGGEVIQWRAEDGEAAVRVQAAGEDAEALFAYP